MEPDGRRSRASVVLVAALGPGRLIGAGSGIPWRVPGEQRRFRELTTGHPLVMGRRTYESIGRPLPGRTCVVITRDPDWSAAGVVVAATVAQALRLAADAPGGDQIMVAGGGEVYAAAIDLADRLEISFIDADRIDAEPTGDTWFPDIDPVRWRESERQTFPGFTALTYLQVTRAT